MMMLQKKKLCQLCTSGWVLCLIGGISIPIVSYTVQKMVEKNVMIQEGGLLYDLWRDVPIPIYMQFYMFNITNTDEVLKGKKPYVIQKGPYSYIEKRHKFNITFNPNGTVSYRQKRIFLFDRSMSVGDETDVYLTTNALYWTVVAAVKNEFKDINKILELGLKLEQEGPFYMRSVKELIWGYHDPALKLAHKLAPEWFYTDFVGYFMNKNDTDDGVYTIYTGEKHIDKLGMIDRYNGSSHLDFWSTSYANMVNGTDGTLGPPFYGDDQGMYLFSSDICRSVSGVWTSDVEVKDIRLRRYTAGMMYLANATINPDNAGFCTGACMDTGLLNISSCQLLDYFHIPGVVSLPHFLYASERIQQSVGGLNPSVEEHQTFVDLEHNTGLVLSAAKRLQINMYIQPVEGFDKTADIVPAAVPIFWLNESAVVNDKYADQLKSMLFIPKQVILIVQIILIAGGSFILLCSVFYGVLMIRKNEQVFRKGGNLLSSPVDEERQLIQPVTS